MNMLEDCITFDAREEVRRKRQFLSVRHNVDTVDRNDIQIDIPIDLDSCAPEVEIPAAQRKIAVLSDSRSMVEEVPARAPVCSSSQQHFVDDSAPATPDVLPCDIDGLDALRIDKVCRRKHRVRDIEVQPDW